VLVVTAIKVSPDDLPHVVDTKCLGADGARQGIVEGGVKAAAVEEAVRAATRVSVLANDLAHIVDAVYSAVTNGEGGSMVVHWPPL